MNPLLVDNKKIDLRYLVVIPCTKPYSILAFSGYTRRSLYDYMLDDENKKDDHIHVTNRLL